jgi:ubiquinone biosynthesis accessory factor UbiJ
MATSSPFSLLDDLIGKFSSLQPPTWVVDEVQQRLVLLLNHVLMQEPEAMARLARLKGRMIRVKWRQLNMSVMATPAGLLERSSTESKADLSLLVTEDSPISLVQTMLSGGKPPINIEGDVQLAAEVNWLADHVRWDVEEDLSRILGDAPAHALTTIAKQIVDGLKLFLANKVVDTEVVTTPASKESVSDKAAA